MTRRSRLAALGDARLRNTTLGVLVAIAVFGLAFGLPAVLVAVLALTCLTVAAVVRVLPTHELVWPVRRDESGYSSWPGVAMVSHGIAVANSSPWEFDRVIRPRLTRLATAALTHHGMAWDTRAAREALGRQVHDALRPASDGPAEPGTTAGPHRHSGPGAAGDAVGPAPDPGTAVPGPSRTDLTRATLDALDRLEAADRRTPA